MYKINQKNIQKLTPIDVVDLSVLFGNSKILDKMGMVKSDLRQTSP